LSHLNESSFEGWQAYFRDRFPLGPYLLLIGTFYLANHVVAQALARPDEPIPLDGQVIAGIVAVFCMFLHLRIFDDHKDYADDCRLFPERALQRGSVTLSKLACLATVAIVLEVVIAWRSGPAALTAAAIAIGFSGLMWREFFVREWLKKHFLIYATTHMLIMPLLALFVYSFSTGRYPWEADGWFLTYTILGLLHTFGAEISRKVRSPSDERNGVATYTQVLGVTGAVGVLWLLVAAQTTLSTVLGYRLGIGTILFSVAGLLMIVQSIALLRFHRDPRPQAAKGMQAIVGISILSFDLALIVALAIKHSLRLE
jgi:hypothetical protein